MSRSWAWFTASNPRTAGHSIPNARKRASRSFDFAIRVAPGPKFFGDQVRRQGPERRFVYVRIGQMAGDPGSPWTRRMKIDVHDLGQDMLDCAAQGGVIETRVCGTGRDGTPACATLRPTVRRVV